MHMPHNQEQPRRSYGRATVTEAMEADIDARIRAGALDGYIQGAAALVEFQRTFRLTDTQAHNLWHRAILHNTRNR